MAIQSRFKCPRHGVPLERRVVTLSKMGRDALKRWSVTFWQCPVIVNFAQTGRKQANRENRCNFCKPDKHGAKVRKRGKNSS